MRLEGWSSWYPRPCSTGGVWNIPEPQGSEQPAVRSPEEWAGQLFTCPGWQRALYIVPLSPREQGAERSRKSPAPAPFWPGCAGGRDRKGAVPRPWRPRETKLPKLLAPCPAIPSSTGACGSAWKSQPCPSSGRACLSPGDPQSSGLLLSGLPPMGPGCM